MIIMMRSDPREVIRPVKCPGSYVFRAALHGTVAAVVMPSTPPAQATRKGSAGPLFDRRANHCSRKIRHSKCGSIKSKAGREVLTLFYLEHYLDPPHDVYSQA